MRRLVLPSPNGSTLSFQLARATSRVIGVSLRNRQAAAEWLLARHAEQPTPRVAVIAAGERWADGSPRPAVEDLWGAGALIDSLVQGGWPNISPEAHVTAAAYRAIADNLATAIADCASGRELMEDGYLDDVRAAANLDRSRAVPLLDNGAFTPAQSSLVADVLERRSARKRAVRHLDEVTLSLRVIFETHDPARRNFRGAAAMIDRLPARQDRRPRQRQLPGVLVSLRPCPRSLALDQLPAEPVRHSGLLWVSR